jgi:hypothetical protein
MAIFDSNKKMYLTFYVALTDPDLVAQYQAQYPSTAPLNLAPYDPGPPAAGAAVQFAAPWRGYQQPAGGSAPFTWSPWSGEGEQDGPYPLNVPSFQRHTGGFLGMGGTTVTYYWIGEFVLAADDGASTIDGIAITGIIPPRRFIEGFEVPGFGLGTLTNTSGLYVSPDAARHPGGLGLALRGAVSQYTIPLIGYGHAIAAKQWERFYVRLRQLPSASTFFWNLDLAPNPLSGILLAVTATGQLALYTSNAAGVKTLNQVIPGATLEVWNGDPMSDAWHRIDVMYQVSGTPFFVMWFDGQVVVGTAAASVLTGSAGAVAATSITNSNMGPVDAIDFGLYLDVDDWVGADIPTKVGDPTTVDLASRDFVSGSKIVRVSPTAFGATHSANWTGDVRVLRQDVVGGINAPTPAALACTTALALAAADTDADLVCDADPGSIGVAAITVHRDSKRGTTSGTLGYSLAGAADVMAAVTEGVVATKGSVLWPGPGAKDFVDVTPLGLRSAKGNDVTAAALYMLHAQAELVGKYTACDYRLAEILSLGTLIPNTYGNTGSHNRPYPRSPWSIFGQAPPISPYIVKGGTYVGNGTGQDLTFRAPVHLFYTRPLVGNTGGYWWMSNALGAHTSWQQGLSAQIMGEEDPTFNGAPGDDSQTLRYRIRIAGGDLQCNQAATTYEYIAVMDPGQRFCTGVNWNHKLSGAVRTWPLPDPSFTPGWCFLQMEDYAATATVRLYGKSSGNAAATLVPYSGGALANALTFGAGSVITDVALHALSPSNHALSFWRRDDGSQDTGIPGAVNFGSYVGDGAASRTINLAPASGRRPLFAIVFPETGGGVGRHRDPSHTGTNSSISTGTDTATGITAGGIDQFTIASGLNANGIVYSYFVLFADATACNNGWGCNGEYAPVEPTAPGGGLWPAEPTEPGTVPTLPPDVTGPTPDPDDPSPDFGADCIEATTAIVNRALHRIGISKRLANVGTDIGIEASVARVNWGLDVNQTLRDHPWNFATRYADLVWVAGSEAAPANKDWTYSYRAPADMLFARRIVGQAGQRREWDPNPPKFRVGSDAAGALIYSNDVASSATPLQIEYTIRVNCPASRGDALFRDALIWRHAASIAAPLTRDLKKMQWAQAMYEQVIAKAKVTDLQEQQQNPAGDADWIVGRN